MNQIVVLFTVICIPFITLSQTIMFEDFDLGIPGGWTVVNGGSSTDTWQGTVGGYYGDYLDGTEFAFVDSDGAGTTVTLSESLESPVFNTTSATALFLQFDHYYLTVNGDTGYVEVFDGLQWVTVMQFFADIGDWGFPNFQSINISAYKNTIMQVRFRYEDNGIWAWYWAVDNVHLIDIENVTSNCTGGGNWNVSTTWQSGTIPDKNSHAVICSGDVVTMTNNHECIDLTLMGTASLTIGANQFTLWGNLSVGIPANMTTDSTSQWVIEDIGGKSQVEIPSGISDIQKLTINRATGAWSAHDISLD
ncbi:MAG: hypothetical protein IH946_06440, partial [Bacteroidetes bacterium]|nr:hypothetical protein [Bacteroidota bacterium]